MHNFRHPAALSVAFFFVTMLILASLGGRASANGGLPDSEYPELLSWPSTPEELGLPRFVGEVAIPNPLPPIHIPANDFLAEQGRNGLHGDNYNSDTLNYDAPLGIDPIVTSRQLGLLAATCPTVVFDAHGNVVTICIGIARVRLFLMDPHSLEVLAEQELPLRAWVAAGRPEDITTDSSGGGYFHVDQFGRALVGVSNQRIQRWEALQVKKNSWEWQLIDDYDLTSDLNDPDAPLQDALPDYAGRLWFTTQPGIIGYLDENTGVVETLALGEFLQNGFAVDTDGATYAVTVDALYRLSVNGDGSLGIDWRVPYLNDGDQGGSPDESTSTSIVGRPASRSANSPCSRRAPAPLRTRPLVMATTSSWRTTQDIPAHSETHRRPSRASRAFACGRTTAAATWFGTPRNSRRKPRHASRRRTG